MSTKQIKVVPGHDKNETIRIPDKVNIEALMLMAKYDDDFRKLLVDDREKALAGSGISFTPPEKMILTKISGEKLLKNIDEFHVPGISSSSLANWRKAAAVIILITSFLFTAANCQRFIIKQDDTGITEGWQDGDTFIIAAAGSPKQNITGIEERKADARKMAVLNAQWMMLEKFKGAQLSGTGIISEDYPEDYYKAKKAKEDELIAIIKQGSVIKETYDSDQNCEVLYRVYASGLKKMILEADWN